MCDDERYGLIIVGLGPVGAVAANLAGIEGLRTLVGTGGRSIVAMPHPGRFKLFGRGDASRIAETNFVAACDGEPPFTAY